MAIGSGQAIVDPFLGMMRKVFWPKSPPTLALGVFCVAWALEHAIELNPGGINAPMQVGILQSNKGHLKASLLEEDELEEHREAVQGACGHLAKYADSLKGINGAEIPQKPQEFRPA